jgi:hypothetical protein
MNEHALRKEISVVLLQSLPLAGQIENSPSFTAAIKAESQNPKTGIADRALDCAVEKAKNALLGGGSNVHTADTGNVWLHTRTVLVCMS